MDSCLQKIAQDRPTSDVLLKVQSVKRIVWCHTWRPAETCDQLFVRERFCDHSRGNLKCKTKCSPFSSLATRCKCCSYLSLRSLLQLARACPGITSRSARCCWGNKLFAEHLSFKGEISKGCGGVMCDHHQEVGSVVWLICNFVPKMMLHRNLFVQNIRIWSIEIHSDSLSQIFSFEINAFTLYYVLSWDQTALHQLDQ